VKAAEPEIAALLTDPSAGTLLILRSEGCPLNIVVSVPDLKALLAYPSPFLSRVRGRRRAGESPVVPDMSSLSLRRRPYRLTRTEHR
jgi:hypothetical protein